MPNNIQTIMRTAAIIYAEDQSARTSKTVKRHYIEAVLVNAQNSPLTVEQISSSLLENFELVVQEDEISKIIEDDAYFTCIESTSKNQSTYYLPKTNYDRKCRQSEYCLTNVIAEYISLKTDVDGKQLESLLHKYLFSLLNTNISAFRQLLEKRKQNKPAVVDSKEFNDDEISQINDFLSWENENKDKALFELICYCIDYASAVNNIDQNDVIKSLRNKCLYLDNALIYRALGVNGQYRKERVRNLLKRCVDSGQTIYVSSITRKEFFDTTSFHISSLNASTPYGRINPELFSKHTDGFGFYQYYHEWRHDRTSYGLTSLRVYIQGEYDKLLKDYKIVEDFKQPFNEDDDSQVIETYTEGIKSYKRTKKTSLHKNDALNLLWIEKHRAGNDYNVRDTKYYFLTSDRKLQDWDLSHSKNQPLTMLPSQWLALLLRFFSRTNNDYKSFVSFLVMPKDRPEISETELQEKLAGISEITEDFKKQDDIISSLLEVERNGTNRFSRNEAKQFAKDKIEEEYQTQLCQDKELFDGLLKEQKKNTDELISKIKEEFEKKNKQSRYERLLERQTELERQIEDISSKGKMINEMARDKYRIFRRTIAFVVIVIVLVWFFLIYRIGWSSMEVYTYIAGTILCVGPFIASLLTDKTIKVSVLLQRYLSWQINNLSAHFSYSKSEQEDLEHALESVRKQIDSFGEY